MCQFVPSFLSYVFAKYYLNWFTVGEVITKIKRVNFLLTHSAMFENASISDCVDKRRGITWQFRYTFLKVVGGC